MIIMAVLDHYFSFFCKIESQFFPHINFLMTYMKVPEIIQYNYT